MSNSLASLLKRSTLDDHEAILKASEDTLKGSPNDGQAQEYKAISLVKLDRYADALKFFESNSNLQKSLPEIYAYVLFKSARYEEAGKAISSVSDSRAAQHIRLQAAYRAEDWATANEAYEQLTSESRPDEDADLRINKLAIDAEGLWTENLQPSAVPRAKTDDLAAFESAYNSACISVAKGQLGEADILLKRAINLCEHHEEFSDAIKITELVPLRAQRLFVLKKLGKSEEAAALAKELQSSLTAASIDAKVRKLADNNILSCSEQLNNPFMAHKLFNQAGVPQDSAYFKYEKSHLSANEKAIQLGSFKYDGLIDAGRTQSAKSNLPSIAPDALLTSMFAAVAVARGEISKPAVKKLLPELARRPKDLGLVLTVVQLYVLISNFTAAIDVIHSFFKHLEESASEQDQKVRYAPGLVGLIISLYKNQSRQSELKRELSKSAAFWTKQTNAPASLLRAAGIVLLRSATTEDDRAARNIFDKLYSQDLNNKSTIAGYVASNATEASKEVKSLANKLTSIKDLTAGVNVDALESAGVQQSANALVIAQAGASRKRPADGDSSKPKRVRKSRLPKDYDPNKKPDPERWLPIRDRSTYKPKKKKGKKDDRTQGGGNVNESLDITKQPAGGSEVVSSSSNNKKKKGKGKK